MNDRSKARPPFPAGYLLGVDVGTASVRAGLFSADGRMAASAKSPITVFRDGASFVEQSSGEIWASVAAAVREAVARAGIGPGEVAGLGFDATCSLVVLGEEGRSLPVGDPGAPERNVIVWMDHRAREEAGRINRTGHKVLDYVGGRISPEMETPKLLWLKENRPDIFSAAWQFLDLTDFLTWRATGDLARSTCTVTCKWTYLAHETRWDESYFHAIGLGSLADEGFRRIGTRIVEPGTALGAGLTGQAAEELGLLPGTPVAAGLIDAHAGGVGSVCAAGEEAEAHLAYVMGTSSCTMTTTREPLLVPGVWGPYYSAMIPGTWLNEGGQSAAGQAIEQLLDHHPHAAEAREEAGRAGLSLPEWLAEAATARAGDDLSHVVRLAGGVQIVPEFLGNRAPHADPHARAVIAGVGMERDLDSLIAFYVAGLCGLGYGLRQILEAQAAAGAKARRIVISGGAGRSAIVRQILADATGWEVLVPSSDEPVLLGSAILAASAAGVHPGIAEAMTAMSSFRGRHLPNEAVKGEHELRFTIFERLQSVARVNGAELRAAAR